MGTVAHEVCDVLAITKEVLAVGYWASPIAPSVEHQQLEALVGERSLRLPLVDSGSQRAVHQYRATSDAPYFHKELAHSVTLLATMLGALNTTLNTTRLTFRFVRENL